MSAEYFDRTGYSDVREGALCGGAANLRLTGLLKY